MPTPLSVRPRRPRIASLLSALLLGLSLWLPAAAQSTTPAPPLMLANVYHPGIALADYWVSEKLDGVRGYWDGEQLLTRGGQRINAPHWFTAGWPKVALDGELWAGRGQFNHAVSTARREAPDDAAWRRMRFMVFDLPAYPGTFDQRLPALQSTLARLAVPWVQLVEQIKLADHAALQGLLQQTVRQGGEGLMLHRGASLYRAQRSDDLLKVKTHEDAEAKVIGHLPGKGKYQGMLGALWVETPDGLRFKLGSGFSDAQRRQPPALGCVVTYRFRGLNGSGIPRFASFMRVYEQ
ncbi:DNA ligase-1 [Collimonas sp. PA-H2]|uniref:DNA ligase n=1 Tax=Collimonas sp. PA-H2 TaxID=1881062 RepID=UPI000BFA6330|nr:DNA ligase-1 [Collimonas sp. PA-H2]